jgi:hypothetical protein
MLDELPDFSFGSPARRPTTPRVKFFYSRCIGANGGALLYREWRTEVLMTPYGRLALSLAASMLGIGGRQAPKQASLIPAGSNAVQVTAAAEREGASYRRVSGSAAVTAARPVQFSVWR